MTVVHFVGASVTELGHKPQLLRAVVEGAISGTDDTLPAEQRDYVKHMLAGSGATLKIRIYADVAAAMSPRTAPMFVMLSDAAQTDTDWAALFTEITNRHAANTLKLAADPRSTGELRAELSDQYVADVVWATAGFEPYAQLVTGRAWTPEQFGEYLRELWGRLFLTNPAGQ